MQNTTMKDAVQAPENPAVASVEQALKRARQGVAMSEAGIADMADEIARNVRLRDEGKAKVELLEAGLAKLTAPAEEPTAQRIGALAGVGSNMSTGLQAAFGAARNTGDVIIRTPGGNYLFSVTDVITGMQLAGWKCLRA